MANQYPPVAAPESDSARPLAGLTLRQARAIEYDVCLVCQSGEPRGQLRATVDGWQIHQSCSRKKSVGQAEQ